MAGYFTESNYENAVLQLLNEELGYNYIYGPDVERDYHSVSYTHLDVYKRQSELRTYQLYQQCLLQ